METFQTKFQIKSFRFSKLVFFHQSSSDKFSNQSVWIFKAQKEPTTLGARPVCQGMVGNGRASVAAVAELSRAYVEDSGDSVPDAVRAIASLGNWGSQTQNQERDLHRWVRNLYNLDIQTYEAKILCQASIGFDFVQLDD